MHYKLKNFIMDEDIVHNLYVHVHNVALLYTDTVNLARVLYVLVTINIAVSIALANTISRLLTS